MIEVQVYSGRIQQLLEQHGLPASTVVFVDNIRDCCRQHDIPENHLDRAGKTVRNRKTGEVTILLPRVITEDMQLSVLAGLHCRFDRTHVDPLATPSVFLEHLVLHEVAHALYPGRSERACDTWAFEQLARRFTA